MKTKVYWSIFAFAVLASLFCWQDRIPSGTALASDNGLLLDVTPGILDNTLNVYVSPNTVGEGSDFATQVLNNPWDMNEYSDISRYINASSVAEYLRNIQVANGIFSAQTVTSESQFYTLFPGYPSSVNAYNNPVQPGVLFPIDSSTYHCFYSLMSVESDEPQDGVEIFWFEGKWLGSGTHGFAYIDPILDTGWRIYSADFYTDFSPYPGATPWSGLSEWQGLRIDPTKNPNIDFAVDWIRLTDCSPVYTMLTWDSTDGEVEIWAGRGAPNFSFLVDTVDGSFGLDGYFLDVQGWEPGSYYLGIKEIGGTTSWSAAPLTIDPAPKVNFTRPSFTSGENIAWEMDDASDLITDPFVGTQCVDYTFDNGILNLTTLPPASLPSDCTIDIGGGAIASDPKLVFNIPVSQIDTSAYRYFSARFYMDGLVQDINRGWMARLLWQTYANGDPQNWCINVSNDIVLEAGWQTITVDFYDLVAGTPEDWAGPGCSPPMHWTDAMTDWLRLDPNENATDDPMLQKIDWVRLSRLDRVAQGDLFPIHLDSSEQLADLALTFYYTTNPDNPTQNLATVIIPQPPPLPAGDYQIYLPIVVNGGTTTNPKPDFQWDTLDVPLGEFYLCIDVDDGLNTVIRCSMAPVEVVEPQVDLDVRVSPNTLVEGNDFASTVLGDGWDMNVSNDIYYDIAGMGTTLENVSFESSIFSARTLTTDSWFYPLFPPLQPYPPPTGPAIDPSLYHCLYLRMSVDNGGDIYDELRVWWFTDYSLSAKPFGATQRIAPIGPDWTLYEIDLNIISAPGMAHWNEGQWQAFRVDPTTSAGIDFQVDWLRLTDCGAVNTTVSWEPVNGNVEIWAGIGQPSVDIEIENLFDGATGSYMLDVQGWEPGTYYIGVKDIDNHTMYWATTPLQINP